MGSMIWWLNANELQAFELSGLRGDETTKKAVTYSYNDGPA